MTKNFCDKCKNEIKDDCKAKLTFTGHVNSKFLYDGYIFCENCFKVLNDDINKFMNIKTIDTD